MRSIIYGMSVLVESHVWRRPLALKVDPFCRAAAVLIAAGLLLPLYWQALGSHSSYAPFAMLGAVLIHLSVRPKLPEIGGTALLALILGIAFGGWSIIGWLCLLGFASMLVLAGRAAWDSSAVKPFLLSTLAPISLVLTNFAMGSSLKMDPRVYDQFLYRFDSALGFQASFVIGEWFLAWPLLHQVCYLIYCGILFMGAVVYVFSRKREHSGSGEFFLSLLTAILASLLLGHVCPAAGPIYQFPKSFPVFAPTIAHAVPLELPVPMHSAVPSLHFTWALLILWYGWSTRWVRPVLVGFFVFTILAALGLGEHYLVDLVVSVPFAAATGATVRRSWWIAAGGLGVTLAWLVALRYVQNPPPAIVAWGLVLGTIAISVLAVRRLTQMSEIWAAGVTAY